MSNSNYAAGDDDGPPPDDDRPSMRRSRSRSPPRRSRRRSPSRSRSRSRDRSKSPHSFRGGRGRDRSPPRGGSRGSRGRRSPSRSGSRSRSPIRGGRDGRDRFRDRGPPPGYGPVDDFYGMRGGYDRGLHGGDYGPRRRPPPNDGHFDPYGRGGGPRGEPHGPPRGGSGPPPRDGGRGDRRRGEGPPGISLLVRNVGPQVTTQDLQMAFGRIGHVRDVYIPRDYHSQQPKGFAFIEYADADMAREARDEMDRFRIKGCELEVVFAQEHRKSPNEMRGRVVNHQNRGRDGGREGSRDGGRGGGRGFERSSSFERHKQRRRDEDSRDGGRHQERGSGRPGPSDGGRQNDDEGGKKETENGNTGDDRVRRGDSDVED